ncbi:MAG: hypothetical protein JSS50_04535 [Proteobacteria bacterium]|nr:hypothetical protein [Pseudomonadota bacterium]
MTKSRTSVLNLELQAATKNAVGDTLPRFQSGDDGNTVLSSLVNLVDNSDVWTRRTVDVLLYAIESAAAKGATPDSNTLLNATKNSVKRLISRAYVHVFMDEKKEFKPESGQSTQQKYLTALEAASPDKKEVIKQLIALSLHINEKADLNNTDNPLNHYLQNLNPGELQDQAPYVIAYFVEAFMKGTIAEEKHLYGLMESLVKDNALGNFALDAAAATLGNPKDEAWVRWTAAVRCLYKLSECFLDKAQQTNYLATYKSYVVKDSIQANLNTRFIEKFKAIKHTDKNKTASAEFKECQELIQFGAQDCMLANLFNNTRPVSSEVHNRTTLAWCAQFFTLLQLAPTHDFFTTYYHFTHPTDNKPWEQTTGEGYAEEVLTMFAWWEKEYKQDYDKFMALTDNGKPVILTLLKPVFEQAIKLIKFGEANFAQSGEYQLALQFRNKLFLTIKGIAQSCFGVMLNAAISAKMSEQQFKDGLTSIIALNGEASIIGSIKVRIQNAREALGVIVVWCNFLLSNGIKEHHIDSDQLMAIYETAFHSGLYTQCTHIKPLLSPTEQPKATGVAVVYVKHNLQTMAAIDQGATLVTKLADFLASLPTVLALGNHTIFAGDNQSFARTILGKLFALIDYSKDGDLEDKLSIYKTMKDIGLVSEDAQKAVVKKIFTSIYVKTAIPASAPSSDKPVEEAPPAGVLKAALATFKTQNGDTVKIALTDVAPDKLGTHKPYIWAQMLMELVEWQCGTDKEEYKKALTADDYSQLEAAFARAITEQDWDLCERLLPFMDFTKGGAKDNLNYAVSRPLQARNYPLCMRLKKMGAAIQPGWLHTHVTMHITSKALANELSIEDLKKAFEPIAQLAEKGGQWDPEVIEFLQRIFEDIFCEGRIDICDALKECVPGIANIARDRRIWLTKLFQNANNENKISMEKFKQCLNWSREQGWMLSVDYVKPLITSLITFTDGRSGELQLATQKLAVTPSNHSWMQAQKEALEKVARCKMFFSQTMIWMKRTAPEIYNFVMHDATIANSTVKLLSSELMNAVNQVDCKKTNLKEDDNYKYAARLLNAGASLNADLFMMLFEDAVHHINNGNSTAVTNALNIYKSLGADLDIIASGVPNPSRVAPKFANTVLVFAQWIEAQDKTGYVERLTRNQNTLGKALKNAMYDRLISRDFDLCRQLHSVGAVLTETMLFGAMSEKRDERVGNILKAQLDLAKELDPKRDIGALIKAHISRKYTGDITSDESINLVTLLSWYRQNVKATPAAAPSTSTATTSTSSSASSAASSSTETPAAASSSSTAMPSISTTTSAGISSTGPTASASAPATTTVPIAVDDDTEYQKLLNERTSSGPNPILNALNRALSKALEYVHWGNEGVGFNSDSLYLHAKELAALGADIGAVTMNPPPKADKPVQDNVEIVYGLFLMTADNFITPERFEEALDAVNELAGNNKAMFVSALKIALRSRDKGGNFAEALDVLSWWLDSKTVGPGDKTLLSTAFEGVNSIADITVAGLISSSYISLPDKHKPAIGNAVVRLLKHTKFSNTATYNCFEIIFEQLLPLLGASSAPNTPISIEPKVLAAIIEAEQRKLQLLSGNLKDSMIRILPCLAADHKIYQLLKGLYDLGGTSQQALQAAMQERPDLLEKLADTHKDNPDQLAQSLVYVVNPIRRKKAVPPLSILSVLGGCLIAAGVTMNLMKIEVLSSVGTPLPLDDAFILGGSTLLTIGITGFLINEISYSSKMTEIEKKRVSTITLTSIIAGPAVVGAGFYAPVYIAAKLNINAVMAAAVPAGAAIGLLAGMILGWQLKQGDTRFSTNTTLKTDAAKANPQTIVITSVVGAIAGGGATLLPFASSSIIKSEPMMHAFILVSAALLSVLLALIGVEAKDKIAAKFSAIAL